MNLISRRLSYLVALTILIAQCTACIRIPRAVRVELEPAGQEENNFIATPEESASTVNGDDDEQ